MKITRLSGIALCVLTSQSFIPEVPGQTKAVDEMTKQERIMYYLTVGEGFGPGYLKAIEDFGPEGVTYLVALLDEAKTLPNSALEVDPNHYLRALGALITRYSLDVDRPLGEARRQAALQAFADWMRIEGKGNTRAVLILKNLHDRVPIREKFLCDALVPMLTEEGFPFSAEILADAGDADIANKIEAKFAERIRNSTAEQIAQDGPYQVGTRTVQAIRRRLAGQP